MDFLTKNVMGVIIAIIGFILIFNIGSKAYGAYTANQDNVKARDFLDSLSAKLDSLENGSSSSVTFSGLDGWYLVGWDLSEKGRPDKCFLQSCICVCPEANTISCNSKGICSFFNDKKIDVSTKASYVAFPAESGEFPTISDIPPRVLSPGIIKCIPFSSRLLDLQVTNGDDTISVVYDSGLNLGTLKRGNQACGR